MELSKNSFNHLAAMFHYDAWPTLARVMTDGGDVP